MSLAEAQRVKTLEARIAELEARMKKQDELIAGILKTEQQKTTQTITRSSLYGARK